jgi:hypothetical protein
MSEEKRNEYLLKLVEDVAIIKARTEVLTEMKAEMKVTDLKMEELVAISREHTSRLDEHEKRIESSNKRHDEMEKFERDRITSSRKQLITTFISVGMAIFSVVLSFLFGKF